MATFEGRWLGSRALSRSRRATAADKMVAPAADWQFGAPACRRRRLSGPARRDVERANGDITLYVTPEIVKNTDVQKMPRCHPSCYDTVSIFRLNAKALSVIATATWLGGWLAGCHTPVLYQNG